MDELPSRWLEPLSERLEAALEAPEVESCLESLRRVARALARAADDLNLPEVAARAREVRAKPDAELATAARDLLASLALQEPRPPDRNRHILLVEDDRAQSADMLSCIADPGRTLHLAATAAEAEQVLLAHPADLVILDLILPDRDGRDLLLQLRESPHTGNVPVIVLSPEAGTSTRSECLALGAVELMEKPVDPSVLRRAVSQLLGAQQGGEDPCEDATTGLLSRAGISEAYRALRSRTGKVEGPLAVALLAVPAYAGTPRVRGRDAADGVMRALGAHLSVALGPRDELGRWSEGELLVLMPGTSAPGARARLEMGLSRVAAAGLLDESGRRDVDPSFTVGIAIAESGATLREAALAAERAQLSTRRDGSRFAIAERPAEPGRTRRILLVEDDRVTATLVQHRLVRDGYDVMDFLNGEDAFRWTTGGSFDLAILDAKVPGLDGLEILERLRSDPRHMHVPVIMLTDLGSEADVVRGLALGANDYLLKPFPPGELLARVRRVAAAACISPISDPTPDTHRP